MQNNKSKKGKMHNKSRKDKIDRINFTAKDELYTYDSTLKRQSWPWGEKEEIRMLADKLNEIIEKLNL
jgi:hypothetical protein